MSLQKEAWETLRSILRTWLLMARKRPGSMETTYSRLDCCDEVSYPSDHDAVIVECLFGWMLGQGKEAGMDACLDWSQVDHGLFRRH